MYICLCQGVTDREIKASIEAGAKSLREVQANTPVGLNCGGCRDSAKAFIDETLQQRAQTLGYAA